MSFLLRRGGGLYTWNWIGDVISEMIAPTNLNEILDALRREGLRGVKTGNRW